jgi:hypothetical protein
MVVPVLDGIDAGRSILGWVPILKTDTASHIWQSSCSQFEECPFLWIGYHPQVANYACSNIHPLFTSTCHLPTPKCAPLTICYILEDKHIGYLPDMVGTLTYGKLVSTEAASRLARIQQGIYWIDKEQTPSRQHHYNLVFSYARCLLFPVFVDIAVVLSEVCPWGKVANVEEIEQCLEYWWLVALMEAALWKSVADATAEVYLFVGLERFTLDRVFLLALLPHDAASLAPDPPPNNEQETVEEVSSHEFGILALRPTFDASALNKRQQAQIRIAVIFRSMLRHLVGWIRKLVRIAHVLHSSYAYETTMYPVFKNVSFLPTRLSMTMIHKHTEMWQVANLCHQFVLYSCCIYITTWLRRKNITWGLIPLTTSNVLKPTLL